MIVRAKRDGSAQGDPWNFGRLDRDRRGEVMWEVQERTRGNDHLKEGRAEEGRRGLSAKAGRRASVNEHGELRRNG